MVIQYIEEHERRLVFIATADPSAINALEELILESTDEVHFVQIGTDALGHTVRKFIINENQYNKLSLMVSAARLEDNASLKLLIQRLIWDSLS